LCPPVRLPCVIFVQDLQSAYSLFIHVLHEEQIRRNIRMQERGRYSREFIGDNLVFYKLKYLSTRPVRFLPSFVQVKVDSF
jgi:hypothetical protein